LPKWALLYCRKLYEQFEKTKIICLSSKPHHKKRNPFTFTEKRKKNTTQSLELTLEQIWVVSGVTQTLKTYSEAADLGGM
jgi:hypothetical protein